MNKLEKLSKLVEDEPIPPAPEAEGQLRWVMYSDEELEIALLDEGSHIFFGISHPGGEWKINLNDINPDDEAEVEAIAKKYEPMAKQLAEMMREIQALSMKHQMGDEE